MLLSLYERCLNSWREECLASLRADPKISYSLVELPDRLAGGVY